MWVPVPPPGRAGGRPRNNCCVTGMWFIAMLNYVYRAPSGDPIWVLYGQKLKSKCTFFWAQLSPTLDFSHLEDIINTLRLVPKPHPDGSSSEGLSYTRAVFTVSTMGFPSLDHVLQGINTQNVLYYTPNSTVFWVVTDHQPKAILLHLLTFDFLFLVTWVPSLGWEDPLEGKGYTLQYSGLENSMDCIVHGVAKSQARLSNFHFTFSDPLAGDCPQTIFKKEASKSILSEDCFLKILPSFQINV